MRKFVDASDIAFTSGASVGAFKGAVLNLKNDDYHALDKYWSSTHLKSLYKKSPKHFQFKHFVESKEMKKPSEEMVIGSAVHTLTLTPAEFANEFFMMPDLNLRTNDGKAARDRILAENPGKNALTDEMLLKANSMSTSIMANPKAAELLLPGRKEAAFFWECPFSGLNFKAKLDQSSSVHFVELKTTHDGTPEEFQKQMFNMHYDLSLVHYREALRVTMGIEVPAYFITVESEAPFVTQVYKVGEATWQTGHAKWMKAVQNLEKGLKKQIWNGYFEPEEIPEINPPAWAMRNLLGDTNGI